MKLKACSVPFLHHHSAACMNLAAGLLKRVSAAALQVSIWEDLL